MALLQKSPLTFPCSSSAVTACCRGRIYVNYVTALEGHSAAVMGDDPPVESVM